MDIRFVGHTGKENVGSLAATLASLSRDEVRSFPALRAHQRQSWHCFVVQLATMALQAAGQDALPTETGEWQTLLRGLTPDFPDDEPWRLVVDDWSKPALLQPPGMTPSARSKGKRSMTPDGMDMLLTGRNHDLKGARMAQAQDDDWLFALVTLQTAEGQMGAGNFGISRMNGGYGSRVFVGVRSQPLVPGRAFRRDVELLLRHDSDESADHSGQLGLLWLAPWDGKTQLSVKGLDPLYIDVCRRIRLCNEGSAVHAVLESSKVARIDAKVLKGVTGDPWAPVLADGTASWGIGASGFGYRQMTKLMSQSLTTLPMLARHHPSDGTTGIVLHACGLTRGQGKTEGFHERVIPIPPPVVRRLGRPEGRDRIAEVAKTRSDAASEAQKIVRHALMSLYQGGPEKPRLDDDASASRAATPLRALDDMIDATFFDEAFWNEAAIEDVGDDESERHERDWRVRLHDLGRTTMTVAAAQSMPRSRMKQWQALSRSRALLERRMRRFVDPAPDTSDMTPETTP